MASTLETESRKRVTDVFFHPKPIPALTPPDYTDLSVIANGLEVFMMSCVAKRSLRSYTRTTYDDRLTISEGSCGITEFGWLNCDSMADKSRTDIGYLVLQRYDEHGSVLLAESMNQGPRAFKTIILDIGKRFSIIETELSSGIRIIKQIITNSQQPNRYPTYLKLCGNIQEIIESSLDVESPVNRDKLIDSFTAV